MSSHPPAGNGATPPPGPASPHPPVPRSGGRGPAFLLRGRSSPFAPSAYLPSAARWRGWPEVRADLRSSLALAAGLGLAGLPAGVLWWLLSPRADFRITEDGPVPVGDPPTELAVADDSVFALVLAGIGVLAGAAAWAVRRRRGVATLGALAVGLSLAGIGAWQIGETLAPGPTEAQLADVGAVLTTPLTLGAIPALAVGPFAAVLAYLAGVLLARTDDLGRTGPVRTRPTAADDDLPAGEEQPLDARAS